MKCRCPDCGAVYSGKPAWPERARLDQAAPVRHRARVVQLDPCCAGAYCSCGWRSGRMHVEAADLAAACHVAEASEGAAEPFCDGGGRYWAEEAS